MKMIYDAPVAELINLGAMERIAALEGHPDQEVKAAAENEGDMFNPSFGVIPLPGK